MKPDPQPKLPLPWMEIVVVWLLLVNLVFWFGSMNAWELPPPY